MPPTKKLDLLHRRNGKHGVEVLHLSDGLGDARHGSESKDSLDAGAHLGPSNTHKPHGSFPILDAQSRQLLLLAIKDAPEHHLRQAFEALALRLKNIPEDIFRTLITARRETAGNAGGQHAARKAVVKTERGTDDSTLYNPHQVATIPSRPDGVHAGGHQEVHNPPARQALLHAGPRPHQNLPFPALYAHPAFPATEWQYSYASQLHHQSLSQVLRRQPQNNLVQGPNNVLGAINLQNYPMDPLARIPREDVARFARRQAHPAPGHWATGHVERRYVPVYHALPVPLGALAHTPDAPGVPLPPRLVARPGPVPGARVYAPAPQLQSSQVLEASGSAKGQEKIPDGPCWSTCANCRTEYDMKEEQIHGECKYHSGILQIEKDIAPGTVCVLIKTHANQEADPENYVWTCCGREGMHIPGVRKRGMKRARFD